MDGDIGMSTELTTARAANRLAVRAPALNDGIIEQALSRDLGMDVAKLIETEGRFPEDGPARLVITSVKRPRGITLEQINDGKRILELAMSPMDGVSIAALLGKLDAITAKRREDATDWAIRLNELTERLKAYPADVVTEVLKDTYRWFPTWAELQDRCEALVYRRRALLKAMQTWGPWSVKDERAWLRKAYDDAYFDAGYYRIKDPKRADRASEAAAKYAAEITKLEGKMK